MTANGRRWGVCSWSLRPEGPEDLARRVRDCGLHRVQLALEPLRTGAWSADATRRALDEAGLTVVSGMMETAGEDYTTLASIRATGGVRPDATWPANRTAAGELAGIARELGLTLVTFHAGFLPHDPADPERSTMLERLRAVADAFAAAGVSLALETGQESADTLLDVLGDLDRPNIGVNFDPANMLLYGMGDPVDALRRLGPHVRQIHVKDALPSTEPAAWGEEVPVGTGAVDWTAFLDAAADVAAGVDLVIEREAGDDRIADVRIAADLLDGRAGGRS